MSNIKSKDFGGRECHIAIVLQERDCICHFGCREDSGFCEWRVGNDFGFFTSMRYVQNDRGKGRCVRNDKGGTVCSG